MGTIPLIALLSIEIFFTIWSIVTKRQHTEEKAIVRISEFVLLLILLFTGVAQWSFRYYFLFAVLFIQTVYSIIILVRKPEKKYKLHKAITAFVRNGFVVFLASAVLLLFPQYNAPTTTGSYDVLTEKYTWVDTSRNDPYAQDEYRSVAVDFWYPADVGGEYPLIVFSHGAFGFSGSNTSTCENLASNGYVVASVNYKYHAFYDIDTDGNFTLLDFDFLNTVNAQSNNMTAENELEEHENWMEWMALRMEDLNFVLDTILSETENADTSTMFTIIDNSKIGLLGHSLGGGTSVQIGRDRDDITSVINLDGTLFGERADYVDGAFTFEPSPYPIPLLNIYSQYLYDAAVEYEGEYFVNFFVSSNSENVNDVVFNSTGHMNFTDLPLFSPTLASMLGTGEANPRDCIETMNELIVEYFNFTLRDGQEPNYEMNY